jgi:hypothetical protein
VIRRALIAVFWWTVGLASAFAFLFAMYHFYPWLGWFET